MYPGCLPNHIIEERQDIIFRRVRGILNKITPETFDKLSKELVNVGLDSPRTLRGVIYLLFDKALKDLKYSSLYAKLCQELSEKAPNFETEPGPNTFCKFLISKCEDEFERRRKATEDFDSKKELTDEEYELKAIAKLKMLGNIKFICELGKKRLLQEEILHECIRGLLSKKKERPIQDQAQDFECLCQIMRTIGSLLDVQASRNLMNQYFDRIDMFSRKPELPSRIRFMLRDVIDLRNNNWRPRPYQREDNVPQPLSKLREEAGYDAAITTNNSAIDKLGNNKNLLGIGDLSKLHGRGLSSLLMDDDGPSFTTTTDFHWGPSSFLSLDEQPFNVFDSKRPLSSKNTDVTTTIRSGNSNINTSTTGGNKTESAPPPYLEGGFDNDINKRVPPQSSTMAPLPSQANNSFDSANSFHKSLTSQFNQRNHSEQRHQHLLAPLSQQPNIIFNNPNSSNRSQDNIHHNRHVLTNNSNNTQKQQHQPLHPPPQRHLNNQYPNEKRNFSNDTMNQNPKARQQPIPNRLATMNNQAFNPTSDMNTRFDDCEPIGFNQPRSFNNNNNNVMSTNNNPSNHHYQKLNEPGHVPGPRRLGVDVQSKHPPRLGGRASPSGVLSNNTQQQQYNKSPSRGLSGEVDDLPRQQLHPPSHNRNQVNNDNGPFYDSQKHVSSGIESQEHREPQPKFRSRAQNNISSDLDYTQQQNQGPPNNLQPNQPHQNRHSKFSSGPNYRHARGMMSGDSRGFHGPKEQQGYFEKNSERTPESELNMNWRAKPIPSNQRRDGGARSSGDDPVSGHYQQQPHQSVSPIQHPISATSGTDAMPVYISSNQTMQSNMAPKLHPTRTAEAKIIVSNSRFNRDRQVIHSNPNTVNKIPSNQQHDYRPHQNFADPPPIAATNHESGGFGNTSQQQTQFTPRGFDEPRGNLTEERDRDLGPPRFHRDVRSTALQDRPHVSNFKATARPPIHGKAENPSNFYNAPRFNDERRPLESREVEDLPQPPPVRRDRFDPPPRQIPHPGQPSSAGAQPTQPDTRRESNRPPMARNFSDEFSDRREMAPHRKFVQNFSNNNPEQKQHQQRFRRDRHDDQEWVQNHKDHRNTHRHQKSNLGPRAQHVDQNELDSVPSWRKDNLPPNTVSNNTASNSNQNNSAPKETSIAPNLAPFLNKPRAKVTDTNFSLRPSHNLIGRTLSTAPKTDPEPTIDEARGTSEVPPREPESKTIANNVTPSTQKIQGNNFQRQADVVASEPIPNKEIAPNNNDTAKSAARDFHVNKFVAALADYSTNSYPNANRAAAKIKELKIPKSYQSDCLVNAMKQSILKTETERDQVGKLLAQLVPQVFDQSAMVVAFKVIFDQLRTLEVETPKVKSLIAGFLSQALLDNLMSLEELSIILQGGKHHPLFLLVLQKLQKAAGQIWLSEKFTASKINLMDMLPEADRTKDRLATALKDRCLGFLDTMLTIEPDLWAQMVKEKDVSPASVYRWIKDNIDQSILSTPPFAHVLMTCLLKYIHNVAQERAKASSGLDSNENDGSSSNSNKSSPSSSGGSSSNNNAIEAEKEMLTKYQPVLQAILKDKRMQLATLYSVQSFHHGIDFPKGSLLRWFHMLYEMNIVDDDVYFTWKEEINDEFSGKGQALFQVNAWLNWLAEDDSEDEEEV